MKKYHLVYQITNTLNNHIYIGVHTTNELEDGYMGSGTLIRKAIKESRKENFKKEILFFCNTKEEMLEKEKELVNLDFIKRKDTYNRIIGGSQFYALGMTHTEETKKRIGEIHKNKIISEETRKRISEIHKNKIISEETRRKMSESCKGKIISEETKKKMSESCKGKIVSEETRRKKMSESRKRLFSQKKLDSKQVLYFI